MDYAFSGTFHLRHLYSFLRRQVSSLYIWGKRCRQSGPNTDPTHVRNDTVLYSVAKLEECPPTAPGSRTSRNYCPCLGTAGARVGPAWKCCGLSAQRAPLPRRGLCPETVIPRGHGSWSGALHQFCYNLEYRNPVNTLLTTHNVPQRH